MGDSGATSIAVMADAQLSRAKSWKPFPNFEKVYQGQPATLPIAIPAERDVAASHGRAGLDPNLMQGISVPEGARVLLQIPMCIVSDTELQNPFRFYSYQLVWRYRRLADFKDPPPRTRRRPYHRAQFLPGAPDSSLGPPEVRLTIPAFWNDVAYEQSEPTTGPGESHLRPERVTPLLDTLAELAQPLLPDGSPGVIQQGVFDPATTLGAAMPSFFPYWTDASADELFILVTRQNPTGVWDFTDPALDLAFSNVYGTGNGAHAIYPDVGIYVQTGTNP